MNDQIKVAVIGLGRAGAKHALVYDKLFSTDLVAVCDINEELTRLYAEKLGAKGFTDYHTMLRECEIDAVSIVMPDTLHLEVTRVAIEKNVHILLEKPIASNIEDAEKIVELARNSSKVFMVAHILRYMPQHSLARQKILNDEIGDIVYIAAHRNSTIGGAKAYSSHHTDTPIHLMVHDFDYINWIVRANPARVFAKARQILLREFGMHDVVLAFIEYENGVVATVEACWILPEESSRELDDGMRIVGTRGSITIGGICSGLEVTSSVAGDVEKTDTVAWPLINGTIGGSLFEEITSFVNCVQKGAKPLVGAAAAYKALRVAVAVQTSIREKKEVTLT